MAGLLDRYLGGGPGSYVPSLLADAQTAAPPEGMGWLSPEQESLLSAFAVPKTGAGFPSSNVQVNPNSGLGYATREQVIPPSSQTGIGVAPTDIPDPRNTGAPVDQSPPVRPHSPFGFLREDSNEEMPDETPDPEPPKVVAVESQPTQEGKVMAAQGYQAIQSAGGTEEDLSAWDKLSSEVDLFTLGASLLASNDGSSSLGESLGRSMMLARKAKQDQDALAREDDRNLSADARDERRVRAAEERNRIAAVAARYKNIPIGSQVEIPSKVEAETIDALIDERLGPDFIEDNSFFNADISDPTRAKLRSNVMTAIEAAKEDPTAAGKDLETIFNDVWGATQHVPGIGGGEVILP